MAELVPTALVPTATARRERDGQIIFVRMSGVLDRAAMSAFITEYKAVTETLGGAPHVVLADMRGLRTLEPALAQMFGDMMAWARQRGVALCTHVCDRTVQRLQAARLSRQAGDGEDLAIDCQSMEEAERICRAAERELAAGHEDNLVRLFELPQAQA